MLIILLLLAFWTLQVLANFFFKYGSDHPQYFALYFVIGNVFGASSIWFIMKLYQQYMNPNILAVVSGSVTFILVQVMMAWLFHSRPTMLQWVGITIVLIGTTIATFGGPIRDHQEKRPVIEHMQPAPPSAASSHPTVAVLPERKI